MDNWSEQQLDALTQASLALAKVEREALEMGLDDVCDSVYAAREDLTRARAQLCQHSLR